jgi:HlyD family secretion protein
MTAPDLQHIVGIGRIEPELKIVELAAEVRGIVENIFISPGDMITEGESILHMNRDVEQAQVNQAKARMEAQRAVILSTLANLEATKIKTANAKSNFDRLERLYQSGAETKATYDDSKAAYESLLMETNRLEADILSARSFLKQAEADLNLAEIHLRQKMILAPANGKLLSMDVTLGSLISPGDAIGSFAISSPLSAWCEIDELFAQRVQVDQKAYVRPEGMTDTLAVGIVTFAGPYLRKKSIFSDNTSSFEDRRIREVRIRLEPSTLLLYGQRVECVIQINQE